MPKLKFVNKNPQTGEEDRLDRLEIQWPEDDLVPESVTFALLGDRTGLTVRKKIRIDTRKVEMRFVLVKLDCDEAQNPLVAEYHLSTPESPLMPYDQLHLSDFMD